MNTPAKDEKWLPYRHPMPKESPPELIVPHAIPQDERIWVPVDDNVWFRPLCMSATRGYWMNLLRVHGYVLKGSWRYLEHDWIAEEGGYVYEAPGETHTLVVDPHVDEMITMFQVNGAMIYVDPDGNCIGYDDVFTRIDRCRKHYTAIGLGEGYIDQFIR